MQVIEHLEFEEPAMTCDTHVGTFTYKDKDGGDVTAEFYVKCCEDCDDEVTKIEREDAYNEQLMDEWRDLMLKGCTEIKFVEDHKNGII